MPADPSPESWQQLAHALGARMVHHAYCGDHPLAEAVPDDCPFCADRDAYLRYQRKAGKRADPLDDADTVSLSEVRQSSVIRFGKGGV